jgi:hypothetical protein
VHSGHASRSKYTKAPTVTHDNRNKSRVLDKHHTVILSQARELSDACYFGHLKLSP